MYLRFCMKFLTAEGIEIRTAILTISVDGKYGTGTTLKVLDNSGYSSIEGSHILVAAGKEPNTSDIGILENGIELISSGHIKVDPHLRTTLPGAYAVGDCAGIPHFTNIGYDDYQIVVQAISNSGYRSTSGRLVPSTLFTSPEVAYI